MNSVTVGWTGKASRIADQWPPAAMKFEKRLHDLVAVDPQDGCAKDLAAITIDDDPDSSGQFLSSLARLTSFMSCSAIRILRPSSANFCAACADECRHGQAAGR